MKTILESHFTKSLEICKLLKETKMSEHQKPHWEQTLQSIQNELRNINNKEDIFNGLLGYKSKERKRRGLLNGASYSKLANWHARCR